MNKEEKIEFTCNRCGLIWSRVFESELSKDVHMMSLNLEHCPACMYK